MINATRVPFPFHQRLHCGFCLATVLKHKAASSASWSLSVMCIHYTNAIQTCLLRGFQCINLHDSSDVQLRTCSFQVFSKKQGYITVTDWAHQRPAIIWISITFWASSSSYYFLQTLGRPLCCISMWQKITVSVLSGSLQVEVLHLACVDGGGDSNANRGSAQPWSTQIMGTMGQMTADKLSRVEWPEERKRE